MHFINGLSLFLSFENVRMCFHGLCIAKYYDEEMPRPVSIFFKSHHQVALGWVTNS
jgi:hypothetical protein